MMMLQKIVDASHFIPKRKLRFPGHQMSWVSNWLTDWVHDYSPWTSSATEAEKETKFGTKVVYGVRMMPELLFC